jgi:hypothetical protein
MFTNHTLKIAGFHLRFRHFYRDLHYGERSEKSEFSDNGNSDNSDDSLSGPPAKTPETIEKQSYQRAQEKVTDLINANILVGLYGPAELTAKFFTMTYKDNVQASDAPQAIKDFTYYIKKVNWNYFGKEKTSGFLKYVAVMELQPNSKKIHFHASLFNQPWVEQKKLQDLWGHGIVHIKKIRDQNYGWYMSKYLGKNFRDYHAAGKKHYFRSRGLFEPVIIRDPAQVLNFRALMPAAALTHSLHGLEYPIWYGKKEKTQVEDRDDYSLENFPEVLKTIQAKLKFNAQKAKMTYGEPEPDFPDDYNLPF